MIWVGVHLFGLGSIIGGVLLFGGGLYDLGWGPTSHLSH